MKREIKFRAYDAEYNEMIILENSGLQYFDFEGSYSLGFTVDAYSGFWAHEQYQTSTKKAGEMPIMQFTGCNDKKGIEIYEGDICEKITYPRERFEVKFLNGSFNVARYNTEKLMIIGNIHEHPELLNT